VTRVLSGAVLIVLATVLVWLAPLPVLLAAGECVLALGVYEYAGLARASGLRIPAVPAGVAAGLTLAAFAPAAIGVAFAPLDAVLVSALVALGVVALAMWRGGGDAVGASAASVFPCLYLGLPLGSLVAIRAARGGAGLFLLMLTVIASDTGQYYAGRALGRRPLAAAISPKKTIEGAIGGFIVGTAVLTIVGIWWLPSVPVLLRGALGVTVVALGIAGDLFESMLKRSAGVKDSSGLIPGHGGVLDRIDALLFAAPVYYVVLKYV